MASRKETATKDQSASTRWVIVSRTGTEHDSTIHEAIASRAYELFEADEFRHGNDEDHWFRAEQELVTNTDKVSIERGETSWSLTVPIDRTWQAMLEVSVSPRSVLIAGSDGQETRDILWYVRLPEEIDAAGVTAALSGDNLVLTLADAAPAQTSAAGA